MAKVGIRSHSLLLRKEGRVSTTTYEYKEFDQLELQSSNVEDVYSGVSTVKNAGGTPK